LGGYLPFGQFDFLSIWRFAQCLPTVHPDINSNSNFSSANGFCVVALFNQNISKVVDEITGKSSPMHPRVTLNLFQGVRTLPNSLYSEEITIVNNQTLKYIQGDGRGQIISGANAIRTNCNHLTQN